MKKVEIFKRSIPYIGIAIFIMLLLILPLSFSKNISTSEVVNRNWGVPIFYAALSVLALIILVGYCVHFKKKYFWLLLTIVSVCICDVGYLSLSLSSNLAEALLANKIAYFGNCFLPLFLLITIADACRFRYKKVLPCILFAISCVMFVFVATTGYLDVFYKTTEFQMVNGVAKILKTYGWVHTLYLVYVCVYFLLMIAVILYSHIKGKLISNKHVISLLMVVFVNILLWVVERFFNMPVEILSFSYVVTSVITIYSYKQLSKFGLLDFYNLSLEVPNYEEKIIPGFDLQEETTEDIVKDNFASYSDDKLKILLKNMDLEIPLSEREIEIAMLMVKNIKRKKIAEFLFITEHTVKFHISNIYKKTKVNSRAELVELLKKQ